MSAELPLHGRNVDERNSSSVLSGVLSSVRRSSTSALFFGIMAERIGNCRIENQSAVGGRIVLLQGRNIDKRNSCSVLSGILSSVRRSRTSALFFEIMVEP